MYFIKRFFLRKLFKLLKKTPLDMPMVGYWKTSDSLAAIITQNEDGATVMRMGEGEKREKYDFPGFPRGYLLFGNYRGTGHGALSVLKHEIKNQLFNETWALLEESKEEEAVSQFKSKLQNIFKITKDLEYEMLPPEKMFSGVRELWRAMTVLEKRHPESKMINPLKETLTFIMSEDDAYRFRVFWLTEIFNPSKWWFKLFFRNPIKDFEIALEELEHAEVIGDMKGRIRLLRRVLMAVLKDERIKSLFLELCREVDWNKLRLSEGDKYHFRAKYFKVDLNLFEY